MHIKLAVLQRLGVTEDKLLSRLTLDAEGHDARDVLAEVGDQLAGRGFHPGNRFKHLVRGDRESAAGGELGLDPRLFRRGGMPACLVQIHTGVVHLAVEEVGKAPGRVRGDFPALVRTDDFLPAVCVFQPQLAEQRLAVCRELGSGLVGIIHMGRASHGPACGDEDRQLMRAGRDVPQRRYRILQIGLVVGKARGEVVFIQAFSVPIQVENTNAAGENAKLPQFLFRPKAAAEGHRRGRIRTLHVKVRVADPGGLPGQVQAAGLKRRFRLRCLPGVVYGDHPYRVNTQRFQRRAVVNRAALVDHFHSPIPDEDMRRPERRVSPVAFEGEGESGLRIVCDDRAKSVLDPDLVDAKHTDPSL